METIQDTQASVATEEGWDIKELWEKYEDIAMHFNDLLIKLRTQALAAVATLATLVSIFAKSQTLNVTWEIATLVLFALTVLWLAVWIIDFTYYNKLLIGAVAALTDLEEKSRTETRTRHIQMSTIIENFMAGSHESKSRRPYCERFQLKFGRWAFYIIVFCLLAVGTWFAWSSYQWTISPTHPTQHTSQKE